MEYAARRGGKAMVALFIAALFAQETTESFADYVARTTEYLCEQRDEGFINCWPGRILRSDGELGVIVSLREDTWCIEISFEDGSTVCAVPEDAIICDLGPYNSLNCAPLPEEVDPVRSTN